MANGCRSISVGRCPRAWPNTLLRDVPLEKILGTSLLNLEQPS
jgi:hypothetical protein